jgi:hypothetical protein
MNLGQRAVQVVHHQVEHEVALGRREVAGGVLERTEYRAAAVRHGVGMEGGVVCGLSREAQMGLIPRHQPLRIARLEEDAPDAQCFCHVVLLLDAACSLPLPELYCLNIQCLYASRQPVSA